ncbi:MAG: hypothetical protein FWF06_05585 [Symbiobacteriaceae bacterium]|nr:hypothetical protein [Symbiobacteriaceae bacterium]
MFWRRGKEEEKITESTDGALQRGGFFDTSQNMGVFATDTLSPERKDFILNYAAEKICKAGMAVPAVMGLEISKPVVFIGSQIMWGAGPIAAVFVNDRYINEIALIMEDRKNVEELINRIESIESVRQAEEKLARMEAKQKKMEEAAAREAAGLKPKRWWWPFGS